MANIYRIYVEGDDIVGWHTAIYYDKEKATKYFASARSKYPQTYIITETVNDETGDVVNFKEFNKGTGDTVVDAKVSRQEYVKLIRYDITWKKETVVYQHISPDEAASEMIAAIGQDGCGTEWIYITRHTSFVEEIPAFCGIPADMKMPVTF